ncbi:MAG: DUF4153 domain-containing protein [Ignavibacteriae bacterium]|nr:DUF4153 domain-containing protein [Ignavibacteriota bacterium]
MKIPSLKALLESTKQTLLRFPFVILVSLIGSAFMIYLMGQPFDRREETEHLYKIVMVCSLGISFLLSLKFITERIKVSNAVSLFVQATGIVMLVLYYFTLPEKPGFTDTTRYLLFMTGTHLLVSFSPFVSSGFSRERNGFWQFNLNLFMRILLTGVYSGVLYIGLSVAILSFDKLFNIEFKGEIYGQLFFFILGVFNTWFFLSGMPENLEELESRDFYPKGLKIFTQYVLLPLVIIYLLILYLYAGKIIIQWQLPMGWVSYLILGFSTTGIFSLLLIEPLREMEGINWIKKFLRWFYLILFPLIILLFVAILRRTGEYGITERRYFVFVLALWLTFIAFYFSISKIKNIRIIPYSLCIIAFLTSFGPWGAFSMSERSQLSRLEEILVKNNILVNGKIVKAVNPVSEEESQDVSSVIQYLSERKSLDKIQPWFDIKIDTLTAGTVNNIYKSKEAKITELMGIEYSLYRKNFVQGDKYFYLNLKDFGNMSVKGYDHLVDYKYQSYEKQEKGNRFTLDSANIRIEYTADLQEMIFYKNENEICRVKLEKYFEDLRTSKKEMTIKEMSTEGENEMLKYRIIFENINGERENDRNKISSFNTDILLRLK